MIVLTINPEENKLEIPQDFVDKFDNKKDKWNFYFSRDEDEEEVIYLAVTREKSNEVYRLQPEIESKQLISELKDYFPDSETVIFSHHPIEDDDQHIYRVFPNNDDNRDIVRYMDKHLSNTTEVIGRKSEESNNQSIKRKEFSVKIDNEETETTENEEPNYASMDDAPEELEQSVEEDQNEGESESESINHYTFNATGTVSPNQAYEMRSQITAEEQQRINYDMRQAFERFYQVEDLGRRGRSIITEEQNQSENQSENQNQ